MKFQIPHDISVMDADFLKDPLARIIAQSVRKRKSLLELTQGKKLAHEEGVSESMSEQTIPHGK